MNKKTNTMATVGITNLISMTASKGVAFAGAVLVFIGVGGMLLSNKTEMTYLREHVNMK